MQFSNDHRHATTLEFLVEVRDYIDSWPAHPINRQMLQRIEAHLAEPMHRLIAHGRHTRSGSTYSPAGLCVLKATLLNDIVTVIAPPPPDGVPESLLVRRLRRGERVALAADN